MNSSKTLTHLTARKSRIRVGGILWTIRAARTNGELILTRGKGKTYEDMILSPV